MRKKYPFIRQSGLKDCAAACTYMIIKYYHGYVGMNKLNDLLKTTRNGTTAYHIVKTLELVGFKAYGLKGSYNNLKKHHKPFIANVLIDNSYKHFIVVYEICDNYLLIADPANKISKMSHQDFQKIWTGVSLHMYPIKPIVKMKNASILNLIKPLVISNIKYIFYIFGLSLIATLLALGSSFFLQVALNNIYQNYLAFILLLFLTIFISNVLFIFWRNLVLILLNKNIDHDLTNKVFASIIHLPYSYYHGKTTGEVISRINDLTYVRDLISKVSVSLFIDLPLSIITMLVLIYLNAKLFVVVSIFLVFYLLIFFLTKTKLKKLVFTENHEKAKINAYMTDVIRGFETVKGLGIENKMIENFKRLYKQKLDSNYKLDKFYNYIFLLKELLNVFSQVILVFLALLLVRQGIMEETALLTYLILTNYFFLSIRNILNFDLEISEAVEAINRILDLTYYKSNQKLLYQKIKANIMITNLSYSYNDVRLALQHINLVIKPGEKILIGGPSGSGKSTLLKIIMKFYQVERHMVKIGDIDINDLDYKVIKENIVYVGQNEVFFTGPLLDNLTLRGNNYKRTMHLVQAEDILNNDFLGYYMLIEENAFNLSGGQKQRIALARALQNFQVILIDEGFSQMEVSMERQILKNLFATFQNKTIIVVSHRLDNLDLFERFVQMHGGKIIVDEKRRS